MKPNITNPERIKLFAAAREQVMVRLKRLGYDDQSMIPPEVLNTAIENSFDSLDLEALAPNHYAALKAVVDQITQAQAAANDPAKSDNERLAGAALAQTIAAREPWTVGWLKEPGAGKREELRRRIPEFKGMVKIGRRVP